MDFYVNSDKAFIENHIKENFPIYHWENKSYSGQFYSKGNIQAIKNNANLKAQIELNNPFLIIIPHKKVKNIDKSYMNLLEELETNNKKGIYLFK